MTATTKWHQWLMTAALLAVIAIVLVGFPPAAQALDIVILGNNEFSKATGQLTLTQFFPNLRVDSSAAGDFSIFMPIPLTLGKKIVGVFVCYSTENALNFITNTAVSSFLVPGAPAFLFEDTTDQASTPGTCYVASAPPGGVTPAGAALLNLTLHFSVPGGGIFIGAVGVGFE